MLRYLPLLAGVCLAVISGLVTIVGVCALADYEQVAADPLDMTYESFVNDRPDDVFRYRLTDIQHGATVYPEPILEDGQWEEVYVCLFPIETKKLSRDYSSIIVKFTGIKGSADLTERLKDDSLELYYWPEKQSLPKAVYDRMALNYRGMQFDRCLHCEAGAPTPSPDLGNGLVSLGIAGMSTAVFGTLGFYVLYFLRNRRKHVLSKGKRFRLFGSKSKPIDRASKFLQPSAKAKT